MRIKSIELAWFRGAAETATLDSESKSTVVYGVNGSGKSSFVDAIEYVLNEGKIRHLAHEYSGKHQEKAIPNTHKPEGRKTALRISFQNYSTLRIEIRKDGSSTSSGAEAVAMHNWDYQRTVLRQDEVASFIHDTKGQKYSALLPLLGLHQMEVAAENLRQLAKSVEQQSKLSETKNTLNQIGVRRKAIFGEKSDYEILMEIEDLHQNYCPVKTTTQDGLSRCKNLEQVIEERFGRLTTDQKRYFLMQEVANLDLKTPIYNVRVASGNLANRAELLVDEKLEVLQSTDKFLTKLEDEKEAICPACGRSIPVNVFKAHVSTELELLGDILAISNNRKAAMRTLSDTVKSLKIQLSKADVKSWREELSKGACSDNLMFLDAIDPEKLRTFCCEDDLQNIEGELLQLIVTAGSATKDPPPNAQQLTNDKKIVEAARDLIATKKQADIVVRTEALVNFINSLEKGIREEIRLRSKTIIDELSSDIRTMWAILHPNNVIEDIGLYLPKEADKAIDIRLKFYGVDQDSPRLTLSEGYRNSLGLCIFLAMAKRESDKDRPLVLDDVVISMDRDHRGMVVELLAKEFAERQVFILTHDREWYTELHQQLDSKRWTFKTLLPYETPALGIRWSHKTTTFDDARAQLKDRPDSAGTDARKIMDLELALIAERLQVKLPYKRGDSNDKRTAYDFLGRLIADGKKCFYRRVEKNYELHTDAITALETANSFLVSWANRASHTFDVVRPEASKLIDACEKALEFFKCSSCGRGVWFADAEGSEWVQCQCGQVRWRYGKV